MNKITSVTTLDGTVNVGWTVAPMSDVDIANHNAIIMGTVIARRIDKARLWDGTITFSENLPLLSIKNRVDTMVTDDTFKISKCENTNAISQTMDKISIKNKIKFTVAADEATVTTE